MSDVNSRYKNGPGTEPWGTPARMGKLSESSSPTLTLNARSVRYDFIRRGHGMRAGSDQALKPISYVRLCQTLEQRQETLPRNIRLSQGPFL